MNTPKLLVALQGTGKCSRAWNIANQIAEFQRAKIHALNLTRLDAANTAHDDPAKNQSEPQSPKGCLPEFFADKDADTALQGNLAQQRIYKTAREINADLVIVGTDRRTGLHRLLPSATHRLCDAIACHLLAVRSNGPVDGYRRISIAMDPSRSPIKVNETALTFARMATTVKFVIVTPMPLSTPPTWKIPAVHIGPRWPMLCGSKDRFDLKRPMPCEAPGCTPRFSKCVPATPSTRSWLVQQTCALTY